MHDTAVEPRAREVLGSATASRTKFPRRSVLLWLASVCAALAAATFLLWFWSWMWWQQAEVGARLYKWEVQIEVADGQVTFLCAREPWFTGGWGCWLRRSEFHNRPARFQGATVSWSGGWYAVAVMPVWVLSIVAGGAATACRRLDLRRHPIENRCPQCGYDVRATPERCPECGLDQPRPAAEAGGLTV